jgi:polynucleotide 5'-kinase involved in rRNA processing
MGFSTRLSFGPYLAFAGLIALLWGEKSYRLISESCIDTLCSLTGGIGSGKTTIANWFADQAQH